MPGGATPQCDWPVIRRDDSPASGLDPQLEELSRLMAHQAARQGWVDIGRPRLIGAPVHRLDQHPLHLVERHVIGPPIVELGGAR